MCILGYASKMLLTESTENICTFYLIYQKAAFLIRYEHLLCLDLAAQILQLKVW